MISPDAFLAIKRERSQLMAQVGLLHARIQELELALAAAAAEMPPTRDLVIAKAWRPELTAIAV
jgi:hypothetical protein